MLKKRTSHPVLIFVLLCSLTFAQLDRDEVIQITFPTTAAIIDTDTVAVAFNIAPFFALGDPDCPGCDGYLNVYLNDESIGSITSGNSYVLSDLIDGEYFLELEAVDPGGDSFDPIVHDTVSFSIDIPSYANVCPPSDLTIFAGDEENVLAWNPPAAGFGGGVGCGDIIITSIPFSDVGFTVGMGNDWNEMTGFSNAEDVAYTLNVSQDITINVDLCSPITDYDCYIEIFTADENCIATATGYYDNDGPFGSCPESPASYTPSLIEDAFLTPGQYYIIVDGFSTNSGNYEITIYESENRVETASLNPKDEILHEIEKMNNLGYTNDIIDSYYNSARHNLTNISNDRDIDPDCGDFQTYLVYDALMDTVVAEVDTNYYIHGGLTNGGNYCYYVTASYSQGESDTTNNVCGTPEPFSPAPPTNVAATSLDEEVLVTWTSPDVPQLGVPYNEGFDSELVDMWTWEGDNWSIYDTEGNPPPSARFSWTPSQDFYEYSLFSPIIPLGSNDAVLLSYEINLNDFGNTGTEHLAVEYYSASVWNTLQDFSNLADIPWTTYTDSLTGLSGNVQIRFRAYGDDSFQIDYWYVDNVTLMESTSAREITGSSITAVNGYVPDATMNLIFQISYSSTDLEYLDGASLTFPAAFVVNDATDAGGLVYNGETGAGATVTFGDFADDELGELFEDIQFSVNVTVGDISGSQDVDWALSGDAYGSDPHDVSGTLTIEEQTWMEYEFMGYNVYVDSVLVTVIPIPDTEYLVSELTNLVTYEFGVTSAHYPEYESDMVSVEAAPIYLYGDVTGVITDPNGTTLDSAVVSAGNLSDTTSADGVYLLMSLLPGEHTVAVTCPNFDRSQEEVTVVAQADPVTQDFTLIPALARPHGLEAIGGDHAVHLSWNTPGGETDYDLAYYDDFFETQIGCDGGCEFGVRFTPFGYPATLQSLLVSVQGDASVFDANIIAYLDPDGAVLGPVGDPIILASGLDLSSPDGSLVQYLIDLSALGFLVPSGDVYIFILENDSGFMGIANDIEPQSPEYYDRNWAFTGGVYSTIFDATGGDPTLTGDFGLMASFFGAAGRNTTLSGNNTPITQPQTESSTSEFASEFSTSAPASTINDSKITTTTNPANVIRLSHVITPNVTLNMSREDSLVGFSVYEVIDTGDTLVASTDGDTTATIIVPENYMEYCYYVKAIWDTELYDTLESKPSAAACAVTFTPGDADFDSEVTLNDLLAVVDFILGVSVPTADQIRNTDLNMDDVINIADVVMIVDIINNPPGARMLASNPESSALIDLFSDNTSNLNVNLDYDGIVRGIQFALHYDPSQVDLHIPQLSVAQDQVVITSNENDSGELIVVVANLEGGDIDYESGGWINIPYELKSIHGEAARVDLKDVVIAGANGQMIPVLSKSTSVDVEALPVRFALHQNFPNPFNPVTEIKFDLPEVNRVEIVIYNLMGQKVRTLLTKEMKAGYHTVTWDGSNDLGTPLATGVYFYTLDTKSYKATKKMVLLK